MREGHEPEEEGGTAEAQEHAAGTFFLAGIHGVMHEPEGAGEKEEEEHLRESGHREAPEQIAEENEAGGHPRDTRIEKAAHEEEEDENGGEKDGESGGGDGHVCQVDQVGRLHGPPTFDRAEDDGVEEGIEGEVEGVGHEALGQGFAVVEELPHGERADVERGVTGPGGNLTSDLGLIHGGLRIEAAEVDEEISRGKGGDGGEKEEAEDEGFECTEFDQVDELLNLSVFFLDHARTVRRAGNEEA